jgi:cobalt/nickel transport system ATP-binding protein
MSPFELRGISFAYPGAPPVLDGLDFDLEAGERVAIAGGNGVGKTTLLHLMVGLLKPAAGEVRAFGSVRRTEADFHEVRSRAGLLFQDPDDQLFCPTVAEDVAFGPLNQGHGRAEAEAIVAETLESLGIGAFRDRVAGRLSGGEKRLVALATVLAMRPEVLLLDEPTNALDEAAVERLLDILEGLPQAMVVVSHDRRVTDRLASRRVALCHGKFIRP